MKVTRVAMHLGKMYFCEKDHSMAAFNLSVAEYRYYFKAIKEYFGLTPWDPFQKLEEVELNSNLVDEEWFKTETEVIIKEHIPFDEILNVFDRSSLLLGDGRNIIASFVWLIANIYYRESYFVYLEEYDMSDEALGGGLYESIAREDLRLFIALKDYMRAWSWALVEMHNWEESWKEAHKSYRVSQRKQIIKELENDYGEIQGADWKEWEAFYGRIADRRLDKEMGQDMRTEEEWISLNEKLREAESITIRFGQQKKVEISNTDFWVNKLLENHVFPRFIPQYSSVDEAKEALKKPAGRPREDIRVRTLAYGLSRYFLDTEVITTSTSRRFLNFLERLLHMMDIRCNNGDYPNWLKLEDVIQNAEVAKEKPRFYTPDDDRVQIDSDMLKDPTPDDILNWLETPEVIFKHFSE